MWYNEFHNLTTLLKKCLHIDVRPWLYRSLYGFGTESGVWCCEIYVIVDAEVIRTL